MLKKVCHYTDAYYFVFHFVLVQKPLSNLEDGSASIARLSTHWSHCKRKLILLGRGLRLDFCKWLGYLRYYGRSPTFRNACFITKTKENRCPRICTSLTHSYSLFHTISSAFKYLFAPAVLVDLSSLKILQLIKLNLNAVKIKKKIILENFICCTLCSIYFCRYLSVMWLPSLIRSANDTPLGLRPVFRRCIIDWHILFKTYYSIWSRIEINHKHFNIKLGVHYTTKPLVHGCYMFLHALTVTKNS
jgi:hypothetical protein